jgi:hypothetical protein
MWALHEALLEDDVDIVVPATVIAEAWRGGPRQANLARMLRGCDVDTLDDHRGRAVGELSAASAHEDPVDVHVAEAAARLRHFAVVTSNRGHIAAILAATGWTGAEIYDV